MNAISRIDLPWGYVLFGSPGLNEMTIVNTQPGDPPGLRFVSPDGNCGKWSFCIGADPASAVELVLVQGKKDERTRGRDDVQYGEATIHIKGPVRNPADPRDDGMHLTALLLHDYTWLKNLDVGAPEPRKPWIALPPVPEPPPAPTEPPPPVDDWLTPENQDRHAREIARIRAELAPLELDEDRVAAYMAGRNRDLAEVHDDELQRAGLPADPCGGVNREPL